MPEIFINYRTGDEETAANLIARELMHRFGKDSVFFASKSIRAGERFDRALVSAVRHCSVLLAVIGERWVGARTPKGNPALEDPSDWIRREILEAFEYGVIIIPVLVGRAGRLDRSALPRELTRLADLQYRHFRNRDDEADLRRLGDDLIEWVPQLASVDTRAVTSLRPEDEASAAAAAPRMTVHDGRHDQRGGIGYLNGHVGTFVNEPQAPVNTGNGSQFNAPSFQGDGMGVNFVAGNNSGTLRQQSGGNSADEDLE